MPLRSVVDKPTQPDPREALAAHLATITEAQAAAAAAERPLSRLTEAEAEVANAQAAMDALYAERVEQVEAWAKSLEGPMPKAAKGAFNAAEARLASAHATAKAARIATRNIQAEVGEARRTVAQLQTQTSLYVRAVLLEEVEVLAMKYRDASMLALSLDAGIRGLALAFHKIGAHGDIAPTYDSRNANFDEIAQVMEPRVREWAALADRLATDAYAAVD